ncbi:MAG: FtsX-like permease family protein [Verrucomicrobia bacterium]|jgi:putative ABC transport system permease protein|nr:FtsX-like permease family protein [Verrucomicrobiota bacterium]
MRPERDKTSLPRGLFRLLAHPWVWRMAQRDTRRERKRLAVFAGSIVIGVGALVTIHALRASLENGVALQARELLGSDLQVGARAPLDRGALAAAFGDEVIEVAYETSFSSMLRFPGADGARLVQVRASTGRYPFYGAVEAEPAAAWAAMGSDAPVILLESALLEQYGAEVGDVVQLGQAEIAITGRVTKPAPRIGRFAGFAPGAYINEATLEASELLARTSLTRHYAHVRLADGVDAEALSQRLREAFPGAGLRFETPESRQEQLGEVLDRFEQFLSLIALFSLVLGAIGVASAMQAQVRRRQESIAILRCLGTPPQAAFAIYLIQASVLGLIGSLSGAVLAVGIHVGIVGFFQEALPVALAVVPEWGVVLRTTGVGFVACVGFALLPLQQVRDIAPLAVLRGLNEVGERKRRLRRAAPIFGCLLGLLTLLAVLSSASVGRGILLALGFVVVFLILASLARGLIALARQLARGPVSYLARQGIANLFRPNNQTLLFAVSLGLGIFLLTLTLLLRALLLEQIAVAEAGDGPNIFLVDVQRDQVAGVADLLEAESLPVLESAPMVTMRIAAINGVGASELRENDAVPGWVLRRQFRSSYRNELNASEAGVDGVWPPADWAGDEPVPLSLELGMAKDLNVGLGDRIRIDVQGLPLDTEVTHLREVDWAGFNLNFFMIFPEGILEDAPGFHVLTTRIPEGQTSGPLQSVVAASYQNVSVIDLTSILETVQTLMGRISQAVQVLSLFTLAAGMCILVGIFLNGKEQRRYEAVLLRTLGATTRQLRTIFSIEFGVLGLLAALAGGGLAALAYYPLARFAFSLEPVFPLLSLAALLVGACLLSVVMGAWLSRGITRASPLAVLRSE